MVERHRRRSRARCPPDRWRSGTSSGASSFFNSRPSAQSPRAAALLTHWTAVAPRAQPPLPPCDRPSRRARPAVRHQVQPPIGRVLHGSRTLTRSRMPIRSEGTTHPGLNQKRSWPSRIGPRQLAGNPHSQPCGVHGRMRADGFTAAECAGHALAYIQARHLGSGHQSGVR